MATLTLKRHRQAHCSREGEPDGNGAAGGGSRRKATTPSTQLGAGAPERSSTTPFFEVVDLSVSYGGVEALRQFSLQVAEGEIVALLGPNGAGKTTTLKAIIGWARASRGRITFEGRDLTRMKTEDIVRLGVTMVPQGRQVFSRLTVAENLMLGGLARANRGATGDMAAEMLDMFTVLRERRRELAGNLSGGEQQQLVIARALMSNPRLVIFDEPSLGLAPSLAARTFELIAQLRSRGLTIIIVEQNVGLALAISDRAYVLAGGELALSGDVASLRESPELKRVFLGIERTAL
jgi:branched-chain amino acid transport system ATP-binding protein